MKNLILVGLLLFGAGVVQAHPVDCGVNTCNKKQFLDFVSQDGELIGSSPSHSYVVSGLTSQEKAALRLGIFASADNIDIDRLEGFVSALGVIYWGNMTSSQVPKDAIIYALETLAKNCQVKTKQRLAAFWNSRFQFSPNKVSVSEQIAINALNCNS